MKCRLLAAALLAGMLCGCSRPLGGEQFILGPKDEYVFGIDVVDSLAYYDLSFYTRMEPKNGLAYPLKLEITWTSPADSSYRETVYMDTDAQGKNAVVRKYRSALRFPRSGRWTMSVDVSPQTEKFSGLGLIWNEYRWDTIN